MLQRKENDFILYKSKELFALRHQKETGLTQ